MNSLFARRSRGSRELFTASDMELTMHPAISAKQDSAL
jgi:hypothetical protein